MGYCIFQDDYLGHLKLGRVSLFLRAFWHIRCIRGGNCMKITVTRKGIALISILIVMIVLMLLAISIVGLTTTQSRYTVKKQNSAVLRQVALAGIYEVQRGLSNKKEDGGWKDQWNAPGKWKLGGEYLKNNDSKDGCYYAAPIGYPKPDDPNSETWYSIKVNAYGADWCTVTCMASSRLDKGKLSDTLKERNEDMRDSNPNEVKKITVTFKKNCFQYATMGQSQASITSVKIGGLVPAEVLNTLSAPMLQGQTAMKSNGLQPLGTDSGNTDTQKDESDTQTEGAVNTKINGDVAGLCKGNGTNPVSVRVGSAVDASSNPDPTDNPAPTYNPAPSYNPIDNRNSLVNGATGEKQGEEQSDSGSETQADSSKVDGSVFIYENTQVKYATNVTNGITVIKDQSEQETINTPTLAYPEAKYQDTAITGSCEMQSGFYELKNGLNLDNQNVTITLKGGPGPLHFLIDGTMALNSSTLCFNTGGNPVYIYGKDEIFLKNSQLYNQADGVNDPRNLLLYKLSNSPSIPAVTIAESSADGGGSWSINPDVRFIGCQTLSFLFLGPSSDVFVYNSNIAGSVVGNKVWATGTSNIDFKTTLGPTLEKLKDQAIVMSWEEE